jgi:hypothetical protein
MWNFEPFEVPRKVVLGNILNQDIKQFSMDEIRCLSIVYPEILFFPSEVPSYKESFILPFSVLDLSDGDKTDIHMNRVQRVLLDWDLLKDSIDTVHWTLEEALAPEESRAFFAGHFFRLAMFKYFWDVASDIPHKSSAIVHKMGLVSFYEKRDYARVKSLFEQAIDLEVRAVQKNILRAQFAVVAAHCGYYSDAVVQIQYSKQELGSLCSDIGEEDYAIRSAEYCNVEALIFYKLGLKDMAKGALDRGERMLKQPGKGNMPRARSVLDLIHVNRCKLMRL